MSRGGSTKIVNFMTPGLGVGVVILLIKCKMLGFFNNLLSYYLA